MVDRFRAAKRVLDSTPLYDAVAAQDTVTLIRSAIRRLLTVAVGWQIITAIVGRMPAARTSLAHTVFAGRATPEQTSTR